MSLIALEGAVEHASYTSWPPYVYGIIALVGLAGLLLGVMAFGKGRAHS